MRLGDVILNCKNISKSFSKVEVLKNINIEIKKGEVSEGVKICGIGSLKNKKTFTGEKDATSFFLTSRAFLKTCTSFYCSLLRLFMDR